MTQISMKNKDGLWIKKGLLFQVLKKYLFDLGEPSHYLTDDLDDAQSFNWFSFGFFEYIFKSYEICVREAFILKAKAGRKK